MPYFSHCRSASPLPAPQQPFSPAKDAAAYPQARWLGRLLRAGCHTPPPPTCRIGFSQCTNGDAWRPAILAGRQKKLSCYPEVSFRMKNAHDNTAT